MGSRVKPKKQGKRVPSFRHDLEKDIQLVLAAQQVGPGPLFAKAEEYGMSSRDVHLRMQWLMAQPKAYRKRVEEGAGLTKVSLDQDAGGPLLEELDDDDD